MIYAAIVAGGTGTRMGADIPKQFLEIAGKPILVHTIKKFLDCSKIDYVVTAVHSDWLDNSQKLAERFFGNTDRLSFIGGGKDRNDSVFKTVEFIENRFGIDESDIILTHDGVRPFVTQKIIEDNINCLESCHACTTATAAVDTILYSSESDVIDDVPPRSCLFHAQTPQSFNIRALQRAYSLLDESTRAMLTDTCSIFTLSGQPVKIVKGDYRNIKITNPHDMLFAEAILNSEK